MAEQNASPARVLDEADLRSATWQKIKAHYEGRLADLRARNDGPLDPIKTAKLRGRIEEAKQILSLASPVPLMKVEEPD